MKIFFKILYWMIKGLLVDSRKEAEPKPVKYVPPTEEQRKEWRKRDEDMVLRQLGLKKEED